jgi:DNA-binding response OmpR family regulator
LPVLVTTGYMEELPQGGRGGGLRILAKPYRQEDLLARVRTGLEEASQALVPSVGA